MPSERVVVDCAFQQISADEIKEIPQPDSPEWKQNLKRPAWLRTSLRTDRTYGQVASILRQGGLCTVCREAQCPNRQECWSEGTATFMILGKTCTRSCRYCAVSHGGFDELRPDEPEEVARAVEAMQLRFAVVTSVTRDDLPDGGAGHFARTVQAIKRRCPGVGVEVLIPDFAGNAAALEQVLAAGPKVLNHNMETVERLFPRLRPQGDYRRSLQLLGRVQAWRQEKADSGLLLKSGLMVGLSETREELLRVMDDLREQGVDILTLGQYLRPSLQQVPVMRYWSPDEYEDLRQEGLKRGFKAVEAGTFVRSSYHAAKYG
ncbi:MAG: lipoyl synthase [bacterium]|nr:lipoyl synthase [bacterium]